MDIRVETIREIDGTYSVVVHIKNLFRDEEVGEILENLSLVEKWEGGEVWGNPVRRVQNWYHIDGTEFGTQWKNKYSRWESKDYPPWLMLLQQRIQDELDRIMASHKIYELYGIDPVDINSVLLNKYRNGNDSFKAHKDDEGIFGNNPTIISVSFGRTRQFVMKRSIYEPDFPKNCKLNQDEQDMNLSFDLNSGDILVMAGSSQKYFCHEVPKCKDIDIDQTNMIRYNMTFRNHKK